MSNPEEFTDTSNPRPQQDEAVGAPLLDTPENLPGDQPLDDTPPSRTKATGDET